MESGKNIFLFAGSIILSLLSSSAFSQDRLGLSTTRYAGINSIFLNPSFSMLSPYELDVNLGTAGLFIDNKILAVSNGSTFLGAFMDDVNVKLIEDTRTSFYLDALIKYPSLQLRFNNFALGVFCNKKIIGSFEHFPGKLVNDMTFSHDYSRYGETNFVRKFNHATLDWKEMGINFSKIASKFEHDRVYFGVNMKYIFDVHAFYYRMKEDLSYSYYGDSIVINNFFGEVGRTSEEKRTAKGFVFDFGINWIKQDRGKSFLPMQTIDKEFGRNYIFHFGLSITDIGYLHHPNADVYASTTSQIHLPVSNMSTANIDSILDSDNLDILFFLWRNPLFKDSGSVFDFHLPTALKAQFDCRLSKKIYINSNFTYGPPNQKVPGIRKPNQLSVIPRFQSDDFDFLLPVSWYDFKALHIGAAFRYKCFQLGTDRIVTYNNDMQQWKKGFAFDIYASVKISVEKIERTLLKPASGSARIKSWSIFKKNKLQSHS